MENRCLSTRTRLSKEIVPLLQADSAAVGRHDRGYEIRAHKTIGGKGPSPRVWYACCKQLSLCVLILSKANMFVLEEGALVNPDAYVAYFRQLLAMLAFRD